MRIEFAGHLFKAAIIRCVEFGGLSTFIDNNTRDVGCRLIYDLAQAATRTADEEGRARQFGN